jgi:endonuclease III
VLCAVVLSSRAQNSVVREAIRRLGKLPGGFTADIIAHMDTDELAQICKSVHYNKVLLAYTKFIPLKSSSELRMCSSE